MLHPKPTHNYSCSYKVAGGAVANFDHPNKLTVTVTMTVTVTVTVTISIAYSWLLLSQARVTVSCRIRWRFFDWMNKDSVSVMHHELCNILRLRQDVLRFVQSILAWAWCIFDANTHKKINVTSWLKPPYNGWHQNLPVYRYWHNDKE